MARYVVLEDAYLPEIDLRLKADQRISDDDLPRDVLQLLWDTAIIDIDRGSVPTVIVEDEPVDEEPDIDDDADDEDDE